MKITKDQKINPWHLLIGLLVSTFNSSQARVNGELGAVLDNAIVAALISFGSGLFILFIGLIFSRTARTAYLSVPTLIRTKKLKWWQTIGGIAGAFFVIGQGFVVPVVGVAIFVIAVVAGQSCASLLVDKYGLGPAGPKAVTGLRITAAGLAIVGVAIAVIGRSHTGNFNLPMVIYMFVVGAFTSAQHAINGRVAQATKQPWATTTLNFSVGLIALLVMFGIYNLVTNVAIPIPPAPWEQPLLWTGGSIGIVFIVSAVVLVRSLGILVFALVSVVGQLLGAVLLDVFFPTPGNTVTPQVLLGVGITVVAVVLAVFQSNVTDSQDQKEIFVPDADPSSVTMD
jgi:transporter family-2 protein